MTVMQQVHLPVAIETLAGPVGHFRNSGRIAVQVSFNRPRGKQAGFQRVVDAL